MKISVEKRVVIDMSVDEAQKFWSQYHPRPDTVGKELDTLLRAALDQAERA